MDTIKLAEVSGYEEIEGIAIIYIMEKNTDSFSKITTEIQPPIPKSGGASEDGCRISVPTGEKFISVQYHSDLNRWNEQIKIGTEKLHTLHAEIICEELRLSDGRHYFLKDCKIEFY